MLTKFSITVATVKKTISVWVIIIAVLVFTAITGPAMAARAVAAGNENSHITTTTSASVIGIFQSQSDLVLQQGTGSGQVNTIAYSENTIAMNGATNYTKTTQINTGNVVNGQENLQTDRIITFEAGDGGRMISDENVLVQTIAAEDTSSTGCCPWGATTDATLPAEIETVQAGSKLDVTEVSASSSSGVRAIVDSPGTTVSLDYSIDAHGINQTAGTSDNPAIGSATVYVDGNIQASTGNGTQAGTSMEYHDVTSVDGLFDMSKEVSYTSAPN